MGWVHRSYIAGEFVGDGKKLPVVNPATEEIMAEVETASLAQIEEAIRAARRSFDSGIWAERPAAERLRVLHAFIDDLAAREGEIKSTLVAEIGCPVGGWVIDAQVKNSFRFAREVLDLFRLLPEIEENPLPFNDRVNAQGGVAQSVRDYVPVGVVAAITPYNFPFYTNIWKVIPALVAGNSVILRPSPLAPLTATLMGEAAQAAGLPAGVFNVVIDDSVEGGVMLTSHRDVDMVAFTGSSDVGVKIMTQAALTMKRLQLELGGKSAQIFLPDAVEEAARVPLDSCLVFAGQACILPSRVLVPQGSKADVLKGIAAYAAKGVVIGDPADPKTQMGPLISAAQRDRCESFVERAVAAGAKVVTGGRRPPHLERGYFFEPTILDVPDNKNPAAQEEIFGPVICVIGYDDIDHAVEIANDSDFGLAGYIVGRNRRLALDVARRLRAGTVNVNGGFASAYASSGGFKMSGVGRERGVEGLRAYQMIRCLNIFS